MNPLKVMPNSIVPVPTLLMAKKFDQSIKFCPSHGDCQLGFIGRNVRAAATLNRANRTVRMRHACLPSDLQRSAPHAADPVPVHGLPRCSRMTPTPQDLLKDYKTKRDFAKTQEPSGEAGATGEAGRGSFVIQKHDATRLHYDFRIELDGVLKSWAVTRGPSNDPA